MASVGTYLNFPGNALEVMNFYAGVFDTEIMTITKYGDFGGGEGIPEEALDQVMNSQMLILGGHLLQASDHIPGFGGMGQVEFGNNISIVLMPDSRPETDRLFALLAAGGRATQPPADMGFGYFADLTDKYGINWMFFNAPE